MWSLYKNMKETKRLVVVSFICQFQQVTDSFFCLSLYIYIYTYISIYLYIFIYLYLFIFYLYNLPIWPRCLSVQLCVAVRCNVSFLSTTMMGPGWSLVVSILFSYAYNYVYRVYVWCHVYYTVSFWNCLLLQSINSVFCRRIYDIYNKVYNIACVFIAGS